ncbi:MAG: serine hydroxymethyltransferase, partial [Bacteroidota bacterium]
ARVMAEKFSEKGYKVISGGTDNHSMLIDLRTKVPDVSGKEVEDALIKADITINKNMVPFDSRPPMQASGMRLGTAAVTTRGLKEDQIINVVEYIDDVITNIDKEETIRDVKWKVHETMNQYPLFAY